MPQNIENTTQTSLGKSIGDIFAAFKTSIGVGGAESGMFANLLAETGKSTPKVEAKEVVPEPVRKETARAEDTKPAEAPKQEKTDVRSDDGRGEKREAAEVKGDEKKDVKVAEKEIADAPVEGLKGLEEQMALLMQGLKDTKASAEGETTEEVGVEELALLSTEGQEELSLDDVKDFLASLFPEKEGEEKEALVQQLLAGVEEAGSEEAGSEEGVSALDMLEQAGFVLEAQLKQQQQQVGAAKMQGLKTDGAALEAKAADLTDALVNVAEKISLIKEGRDAVSDKTVDTKLNALTSEKGAGAEDGLYQKMVQDQRQESLGRKNGVAHNIEAPKFAEDVNAENVKVQQANALGQAISAAAQAAKGASETVAKPTLAVAQPTTITPTGAEATRPVGSYDFASQLSATRETKGGTAGLPKVIEQVSVQLHKAVKNGNTEMTLNLKPADLGRVDIKLVFGEGKTVTGIVLAENQTSLNLLQKDADVLVRALQEAGLDADASSMEFSLKDESNAFAQAKNGKDNAHKNFGVAANDALTGDALPDMGAEVYYVEPGRVNLQV